MEWTTVELGGQRVPCRLERTRGRSISLRVRGGPAHILIRVPEGRLTTRAADFLTQHQRWLLEELERVATFEMRVRGGEILYEGNWIPWQTVPARTRRVRLAPHALELHLPPGQTASEGMLCAALLSLAKKMLPASTRALAADLGLDIGKVTVKRLKSKWGSCSTDRNINLNWRLVMLPPELMRYVLVHELMHLREMNHSRAFWQQVERHYPGARQADTALKSYGWLIYTLADT
ncbi:MAG: SprT family zinc-dependent metalloprotease [Bacteroidia bacterium]|nr:SprT family zinc-dependent metalloprotease [Bacteroidia bacterium]